MLHMTTDDGIPIDVSPQWKSESILLEIGGRGVILSRAKAEKLTEMLTTTTNTLKDYHGGFHAANRPA